MVQRKRLPLLRSMPATLEEYRTALVELDNIVGHWIRGVPYQLFITDPTSPTPFDPFNPAITTEQIGVLQNAFAPIGVDCRAWHYMWRVYLLYPHVFAYLRSKGKIETGPFPDVGATPFNKFIGRFRLACPDERVQRYFYVRMGMLSSPHVMMFEGRLRELTFVERGRGKKSLHARYVRRPDDIHRLYADITAVNPLYSVFPDLKTEEYERLTDEAVRNAPNPRLSIDRRTA